MNALAQTSYNPTENTYYKVKDNKKSNNYPLERLGSYYSPS